MSLKRKKLERHFLKKCFFFLEKQTKKPTRTRVSSKKKELLYLLSIIDYYKYVLNHCGNLSFVFHTDCDVTHDKKKLFILELLSKYIFCAEMIVCRQKKL